MYILVEKYESIISSRGTSSFPVSQKIRAQLFKTNDVVKSLIIKYGIYANIFAEKNVSSFCICLSQIKFWIMLDSALCSFTFQLLLSQITVSSN